MPSCPPAGGGCRAATGVVKLPLRSLPLMRWNSDERKTRWRNEFNLGDIARASLLLAADAIR